MYDISQKRKWDHKVVLDYAREEGLKQGIEKGLEKGRKEGIEKGRQQLEKKAYEVVKNLIEELDLPDDAIVRIAGVSVEFVQKVRTELKN